MKNNKSLICIRKKLNNYFSYFKDPNVLVISEDKSVLPFAYIINDYNYPNTLLLCLAVDYPYSEKAVEIALIANKIKSIALSEQFFISKSGTTYIGEDAHKYYDLESQINLEEIIPENNTHH